MYSETVRAQSQIIEKYEKRKESNRDNVAMQLFPSKRYSGLPGPSPPGVRFGFSGVSAVIKGEPVEDSRISTRTRRPSSRMEAV